MESFNDLIENGVIGFYNSCNVIQIFFIKRKDKSYINLYTIFTFEEKPFEKEQKTHITKKLIHISKDYSLGIDNHVFSIDKAKDIYDSLNNKNFSEEEMIIKGESLKLIPTQYIMPNKKSRLNKILKNNFFNGSYVIEFFEENKSGFKFLKEKSEKIDKKFEEINNLIPINLKLMDDRFGNYIFQLPINILNSKISSNEKYDGIKIKFYWHELLEKPPNCFITTTAKIDDNYINTSCQNYKNKEIEYIKTGKENLNYNVKIWRNNPNILLYCDEDNYFKKTYVTLGTHSGDREFTNHKCEQKIPIYNRGNASKEYEKYMEIIKETTTRISEKNQEEELSTVIYDNNVTHECALENLITLIKHYGEDGVYLWDPYLTSEELLSTVYYANAANVPIKAITSKNIKNNYIENKEISIEEIMNINKEHLENCGNKHGLNLEFRIDLGNSSFHDRFLIFPPNQEKLKEVKVYSLGSSINGYGKKYHILQEISTPNKIYDDFNKLWDMLEDNLIWKHPN